MSHPARSIAGEMNFVQMSRSERAFLSTIGVRIPEFDNAPTMAR
jgi:hypothetical protein